jgi:hypothetical protein
MSEQEDGYQVTEVTSGAEEEEVLDYEGEGADADMADAQDPVELGAEASGKTLWSSQWLPQYRTSSTDVPVRYSSFPGILFALKNAKASAKSARANWISLRRAGEPLLRTLRAKLRFKEEMVGRVQAESNAHALSARLFEHELEGLKSKVKDLTRDLKDQTDIAVAFQGDCLRLEEELGEYRESVQRLRTEVGALSKENEDLRGQVEDYRGKADASTSRVLASALAKPPLFDGKGLLQAKGAQQVEDWIIQVQRYTNSLKLSEADAVSVAANSLRDEAARAWATSEVLMQANNQPLTLEAVKKCLLSRFTPAATIFQTRKQLFSLQLGKFPGKTLTTFVQEYDRLSALIPDLAPVEKIHHFIAGIERGAPSLVQRCCIDPVTSALFTEYSRLRGATLNAAVHTDFQQAIGAAAAADADKTAKRLDSAAGGKKPRLNSGTYSSKAAAGASTGNGAGSSGVANSAAGRSAGTASGAQQDGKSWCPFRPDKIRRFCASKSLCLRCYKTGHQKNDCKAATPATGDPPGFQSA